MINYLLQQIQGVEGQALQSQKKSNELNEKDRAMMQQRSIDLTVNFDTAQAQLSEVMSKLNVLQQEQQRADQMRNDLQ